MSKSRSVYDRIQAIDKIGDSTFRSNIPGLIEVEIGDAKQEAFHPQIKIKKWNNEANFSMRLRGSDGIFDATKDRVVYQSDEFAANFYPKEKAIEPSLLYPRLDNGNDGGFEFDITLYSRPAVDFLDFTVQTKNVILCEQPDLTPGDIRLGARRPLNVTGSIAIYHEYKCWHAKGGMDYGCGKVGHLFRPLVRDSAGNMAWGRFHIIHDRDGSPVIRLTIPGRYLDNAVYPILIDPFFGYLTQGGTSFSIQSVMVTTEAYAPNAGTLEMLSTVTQIGGDTGIVAMCMYSDAGSTNRKWSSITYSETYTDTTKIWRQMQMYQYPSFQFKAGEDFCIAVQGNTPVAKSHNAFYDTVSGYTIRSSSVTNAWAPSWPTISAWSTTSNSRLTATANYRYWEDEMINIKTGEEIVLACFTLPASLASGVKIVFLNATTGDGNDIGDDVTTDYITQTAEVVAVTTPAAASITQADYFTVSSYYYGSESTRAVWFDIDANGSAPTGAAYVASDSKSEVDILSTDNAAQVSAKVHAVVNATGQFTSVDNSGSVTITSTQTGPPEAGTPDDYSAAGGSGTGSTTSTESTAGVDNSVCRESDDLSGLYTWDMAGFNTEPTADTELLWYMYSTYFSTIVSPPQRVVFGKVADDVNDILVDTGTTLDALIKDVPTVAEFNARSLVAADYTVVTDLGVVQSADHTVAIADIPTVAEFNARSLLAADYTVVADLGVVQTADHTAGIADIPTVAEFNARSLVAADYTVVGDLGVVQTGDSFAIVNGAHGLVSIQDDVDAILIDTAQIGSAVGASISADIAAVKAETALIVADTNELQTDNIPGTLSTIEGKIDTVDGIVDNILTDTAVIGAAGIGLSAIPWNAAWDAEVQSEVTDALNSYDPPTHAELILEINDVQTDIGNLNNPTAAAVADAVWDEAQVDHVGIGTFGIIASEIAYILVDTAEIGAAGIGLGAIPWNAAWDAQVESEVTDALNSYDPPTRAEATADKDAVIAEVNANEAKIDIIQAVTDVLPNAGALTDIDTGVNNIEAKLPSKSKITGSDNVDGDIELDDATGALPAGAFANHPDIDLNADQSGVTVGTVNAIAAAGIDGILDEVVETEGNITMRQVLSILVANLAGTTAGGGTTTITFNTPNGNAARIEMTVDSDGDRSVVTLTP